MAREKSLGIGIIGLGFMGRTHIGAYAAADLAGFKNHLVAVADESADRRSGRQNPGGNLTHGDPEKPLFDPMKTKVYSTAAALCADPDVDVVSICTPTDTHVAIAMMALEAGKHVLVEKPVGLDAPSVKPLMMLAKSKRRQICMPALCIRFWPAYAYLKQRIDDGSYGKVLSASFQRLGTPPRWSAFYADPRRSGGALVDLHLHDTDFLRYSLGDPAWVMSTGSHDHVTTLYHYENGPGHVAVEGAWDHTPGFQFRMRYIVVFEKATLDFDFTRHDQLLFCHDHKSEPVALEALTGYDVEIRYLIAAIRDKKKDLISSVAGAYETARLLDAEKKSLETSKPVKFKAGKVR